MPVFLQTSIEICEKIEKGEIETNVSPYTDPQTGYLISILPECDYTEWQDCTPNNQPDWMAFRPECANLTTLYLKNKHSKRIYFITN